LMKESKLPDYLAILDFEATCDNDRSFRPQEIIEWPTILIDTKTFKVPENGIFHTYIKPVVNPVLTSFCTELTGITQDVVNKGPVFKDALKLFQKFLSDRELNTGTKTLLFVTCGDWDLKTMLPAQLTVSQLAGPTIFSQWCNLKFLFSKFYKERRQTRGMGDMLKSLGLNLEGHHHSGIDDCKNIVRIVQLMLEDGCIFVPTFVSRSSHGTFVDNLPPTKASLSGSDSSSTLPQKKEFELDSKKNKNNSNSNRQKGSRVQGVWSPTFHPPLPASSSTSSSLSSSSSSSSSSSITTTTSTSNVQDNYLEDFPPLESKKSEEEKEIKDNKYNNKSSLKYQKKQPQSNQQSKPSKQWKPKEKEKTKLRTSEDVFKRVRWDPQYDIKDFVVVYEDRLMGGMIDKPMSEWTHDEVDSIPFHRIWQFKHKGQIVWDRKSRLDLLFN